MVDRQICNVGDDNEYGHKLGTGYSQEVHGRELLPRLGISCMMTGRLRISAAVIPSCRA